MSCGCAGLPSSFDRFREVWHVDYEFRSDANHLPVPVAMFAKEHRSGTEITMRRDRLLACTQAPFNVGPDAVMIAYSAIAELSVLKRLGWSPPHNVIDVYVETSAAINGLEIVGLEQKRPSLLEACDLFNIPHMSAAHKAHVRGLILSKTDYTEGEWHEIDAYNRDDVMQTIPLLEALAPTINVQAALFRGRFLKMITGMEARGIPIDAGYLAELEAKWQELRMFYIGRDDEFGLYDDSGSFREDRFGALVKARGWVWPLTPTGQTRTA